MKRGSIKLYTDLGSKLGKLTREEKGAVFEAIFAYANEDAIPDDMPIGAAIAWDFILPMLEAASESYENTTEQRVEAGKKGAAARWGKNSETIANDSETIANDSEAIANDSKAMAKNGKAMAKNGKAIANDSEAIANDGYKEKDKDKDIKEKVLSNDSTKKKTAKRFIPPTIDEVRAYCSERGNFVDPESFISFYESNGWKVGRNTMVDWKAAVRTWEHRDSRAAPTDKYAEIDRQFLERYKDDTE